MTWPRISPSPGEAVLEHPGPGVAPLVLAAQRRERHPQVAGRKHPELRPQPPRRAAVVGHGDHGGQLVDDQVVDQHAERAQRRGEPVAAAEGDHRLGAVVGSSLATEVAVASARASNPASTSRRATSSVIATLRCLPPVQPIATVMNRLPSRR